MISSSDILHGKILIVDDKQANILLLERMLRGVGYDSIAASAQAEGYWPAYHPRSGFFREECLMN